MRTKLDGFRIMVLATFLSVLLGGCGDGASTELESGLEVLVSKDTSEVFDTVELPPPCVPDCSGVQCGPDPLCGESCGSCGPDEVCHHDRQCVPAQTASTWTDPKSGLTWQNPSYDGIMEWGEAKHYCDELSLEGGGWDLPSIGGLRTLIRGCPDTESGGSCNIGDGDCLGWLCMKDDLCDGCLDKEGPAEGGMYAPDEIKDPCCWYWSSSRDLDTNDSAWVVSFEDGDVMTMTALGALSTKGAVRCMR